MYIFYTFKSGSGSRSKDRNHPTQETSLFLPFYRCNYVATPLPLKKTMYYASLSGMLNVTKSDKTRAVTSVSPELAIFILYRYLIVSCSRRGTWTTVGHHINVCFFFCAPQYFSGRIFADNNWDMTHICTKHSKNNK